MDKQARTGYCVGCAHNTEHNRYVGSVLIAAMHSVIRLFASRGGYGPWYCVQCRRISSFAQDPFIGRKEYAEGGADYPQAADVRQAVGLVPGSLGKMQEKSVSHYSEKYRYGVARRIVREEVTFKQISEEIGAPRREIWSWLVELFLNDQRRIEQLKRRVRYLEDALGKGVLAGEAAERHDEWNEAESWSTIVVGVQVEELPHVSSSKFAR